MARALDESGLSRVELARRIGRTGPSITHYLNRDVEPPAGIVEAWFRACGFRLSAHIPDDLAEAAEPLTPHGRRELARLARAWGMLTPEEQEAEADAMEARARRRRSPSLRRTSDGA